MISYPLFLKRKVEDAERCKTVDKGLKICINCGYDDLDKTEFCLSCENCGNTMYFE